MLNAYFSILFLFFVSMVLAAVVGHYSNNKQSKVAKHLTWLVGTLSVLISGLGYFYVGVLVLNAISLTAGNFTYFLLLLAGLFLGTKSTRWIGSLSRFVFKS